MLGLKRRLSCSYEDVEYIHKLRKALLYIFIFVYVPQHRTNCKTSTKRKTYNKASKTSI